MIPLLDDRTILQLYEAGKAAGKQAADATPSYSLAGTLQLLSNGWLVLTAPNAYMHGLFAALNEPGSELPKDEDGRANAAIAVMSPEELAQIGGADRVDERGKQFHYSTGRFLEVVPDDAPGLAKMWISVVHSPELQTLRRSYGLPSLPEEGSKAFHVVVAVRRRGVLGRSDATK